MFQYGNRNIHVLLNDVTEDETENEDVEVTTVEIERAFPFQLALPTVTL